jgi:NAD(P)-dependent dehydrogenase (short-subunit alcohol dehydrogenase family)
MKTSPLDQSLQDHEDSEMKRLIGKAVLIVGGTRGIGRAIAETAEDEGAGVAVVGRDIRDAIHILGARPRMQSFARDATDEDTARATIRATAPDIVVVCAGAVPPTGPIQKLSWTAFSANWETDVKASFLFCKEALRRPLRPGSTVILISSAAAIGGSPITGGYAGAKRMQLFLAKYAQQESDRLELGLTFVTLAPSCLLPETAIGATIATAYAKYLGTTKERFLESLADRPTALDVARWLFESIVGARNVGGSLVLASKHSAEIIQ